MVLRIIGRIFIGTGILLLVFVGYEMFGTRIVTQANQRALSSNFAQALKAPKPTENLQPAKPDLGDGVARLQIPKIGVDWVVVEGVGPEALKKGPGHYPGTPFPGEPGNVVISGHRNIYGSPFWSLDEIQSGDEIKLVTLTGTYVYRVASTKIVAPTEIGVIADTPGEYRLTLTTCHPKMGAKKRLIVVAQQISPEPKESTA